MKTNMELLYPLFKKIWEEEQVPSEKKEGYLIKVRKKGDLSSCSNYGGITPLSTPGKVFSRVLLNRMKGAVGPQLRDQQAGFCMGRCCTDHIAALRVILEHVNMLCGLVLLATGAGWWGCQLQFEVHNMTVQSDMSGTKLHQNDLLLPGQQVVVIPLWSCHCERSDESSFHWSWHCCHAVLLWHPPLQGCPLAHFLIFHSGLKSTVEQPSW